MMMNAEGGCQAPSSGPLQLVLLLTASRLPLAYPQVSGSKRSTG
jgi:hypothetical protein